jgi:hypothetical protein
VGVTGGFLVKGRDVQAPERHIGALPPVVVGEAISAPGRGDVDLDHHEVGLVVERQPLDVLVLERDLVVVAQIAGKSGQAEGREERVLDGAKEGAYRLGEGGEDHLHLHERSPVHTPRTCTDTERRRGPSSSTRNTLCHSPRSTCPSATFKQTEAPRSSARAWACPLGFSSRGASVRDSRSL